ncbi:glycosyltransferase family 2 protein [Mycobacterium asiaticum]|uniref:glycosyltransferase family 2 protein n=1 Tax=Mycobacterium asiaticum TaxID=1790 RepID=UPI0007EFAD43|nr:glycosyltransferase family 2 protein [Mycobacterium asiaticum]OBI91158.1 hypothetical protein A5661_27600 [Mycobacterium asiaticum]
MSPSISVCIPMYNNDATIARCLRSVIDQDGVDFEILVVDDASSDDGVGIAAALLRAGDRLVRNESRLGLNGNHNKCLELARGTCIQFVHGDDWLLPGALRTLAQYFEDPDVGLAFAPRRVVGGNAEWQQRYGTLHHHFRKLEEHNPGPSLVAAMLLRGRGLANWIGEPTCVMFRKRLAEEVGGFRSDIYQLVDLDLWLRLMLRSAVCFVPQELSVRSHTSATATTGILATRSWWLDQLRVLTWMIIDSESTIAVRFIAGGWWFPTWVRLALEVILFGPNRWQRFRQLLSAPVREFTQARQFRRLLHISMV